jgi:hypothetical protein
MVVVQLPFEALVPPEKKHRVCTYGHTERERRTDVSEANNISVVSWQHGVLTGVYMGP